MEQHRPVPPDRIVIRGGRVHNLKNIDLGYSAAQDRGHCGSIRLRQILAGAGHFVRRRLPAVSGVTFHLHTPPDDPGRKGAGGPGARRPGGTGTAASGCAGLQHLRHRHGAIEQPAADVLPPGKPPLPRRVLPAAQSAVAAGMELVCPVCAAHFFAPGAEELAFNSQGACQRCDAPASCAS